jgi:hypothetical protein
LEISVRALIVGADVIPAASIKVALAEENLICDTIDLGEDGLEIGRLHGPPVTAQVFGARCHRYADRAGGASR